MSAPPPEETLPPLEVQGVPLTVRRNGATTAPALLLAHGAGAPLDSAFLEATALALAGRGLQVLRFNFPFTQRRARGEGRRPTDPMPRLVAAYEAVLATLDSGAPWVLGGKSLGARVAAQVAERTAAAVRGLLYLGFPLHPRGRPSTDRAAILSPRLPQLFISGDRDPLAREDLLSGVVASLGPLARWHRIPGGDHDLATSRRQPLVDAAGWWDAAAAFVHEVLANR